jgi:hypothetical protein
MPTYAADLLPESHGRGLGSHGQRWHVFGIDLDLFDTDGSRLLVVCGPESTQAGVLAAKPSLPVGSLYLSTSGKTFLRVANSGVSTDWQNLVTSSVDGNLAVSGTLGVTGATTLSSTLAVTGAITATGGLVGAVTGNTAGTHTGAVVGNVTGNVTGALNGTVGATTPNTGAFTTLACGTAKTNFSSTGLITRYVDWPTAGKGVPPIYAVTSQKSETAADTSVLTLTPPAEVGTYRVNFVMSLSAATSATIGWTMTWKDSNGTAQSPTNLSLIQSGTAAPALTFTTSAAGNYHGTAIIDVDSSATAIVVKTTFSGTSFAGKASATIERIQ